MATKKQSKKQSKKATAKPAKKADKPVEAKKDMRGAVKNLTCSICKARVRGVSVMKHLWEKHRQHMMENRARGPRKPKTERGYKIVSLASVPDSERVFLRRAKHASNAKAANGHADKFVSSVAYEVMGARLGKQSTEAALAAIEALCRAEVQ